MLEVLVKDLHSGGERKFSFNRWNCEDFETIEKGGLPIQLLRERCSVMFNFKSSDPVRFLCSGHFYGLETDRLPAVSESDHISPRTIYLLPAYPIELKDDSFHIDSMSFSDAQDWLSEGSAFSNQKSAVTAQLIMAFDGETL